MKIKSIFLLITFIYSYFFIYLIIFLYFIYCEIILRINYNKRQDYFLQKLNH